MSVHIFSVNESMRKIIRSVFSADWSDCPSRKKPEVRIAFLTDYFPDWQQYYSHCTELL